MWDKALASEPLEERVGEQGGCRDLEHRLYRLEPGDGAGAAEGERRELVAHRAPDREVRQEAAGIPTPPRVPARQW